MLELSNLTVHTAATGKRELNLPDQPCPIFAAEIIIEYD